MDQKDPCVIFLRGNCARKYEEYQIPWVSIARDLMWNKHASNIYRKANRTLGFFKLIILACPQDVKERAYKGLVSPVNSSLYA